jgi:hypothetical protein
MRARIWSQSKYAEPRRACLAHYEVRGFEILERAIPTLQMFIDMGRHFDRDDRLPSGRRTMTGARFAPRGWEYRNQFRLKMPPPAADGRCCNCPAGSAYQ